MINTDLVSSSVAQSWSWGNKVTDKKCSFIQHVDVIFMFFRLLDQLNFLERPILIKYIFQWKLKLQIIKLTWITNSGYNPFKVILEIRTFGLLI